MMRFTWTVAGDDPDYGNCRAHGINGLFAPLFDPLTTKLYLRRFAAEGFAVRGLYLGHNWFPALGPVQLADKVVAEYKRLTFASGEGDPALRDIRLMLNLEQHDPAFILACCTRVRALLPKVGLSWSPEGHQGGWQSKEWVTSMVALKIRAVPQCFVGNMERRESSAMVADLVARGWPFTSVSPFLDASQLGHDWEGYAFTEGRLPRIV